MSSEQKTSSHDLFKAAQKAGWNNVAQGWMKWWITFEQGAQSLSDRLVELAGVKPGDRVLDIATGIGEPAITAAKRMQNIGQVVATDISPEMLAIARQRAQRSGLANIVFEESDAETYPYPTSMFNSVISRWGIMFLPDFVSTMQRIRQSLVEESGLLSVAVWSDSSRTPLITIPMTRAAQAAGIPEPTAAGNMGPFRFADPRVFQESLYTAGFKAVQIEKMKLTFSFDSVSDLINFHKAVSAPVVGMLKKLPDEDQEQAWKTMADDFSNYADADRKLKITNEVIVASAGP